MVQAKTETQERHDDGETSDEDDNNQESHQDPFDDLLLEDLKISVPVDKLIKVGVVASIVDNLVVVDSIKKMPPLDLDTVLFDSSGESMGRVYDVFGAITEPHYSIKFKNKELIIDKEIRPGIDVHFLPETDRSITKFAFLDQIKKIKGTDASGLNDNELPQSVNDSDED